MHSYMTSVYTFSRYNSWCWFCTTKSTGLIPLHSMINHYIIFLIIPRVHCTFVGKVTIFFLIQYFQVVGKSKLYELKIVGTFIFFSHVVRYGRYWANVFIVFGNILTGVKTEFLTASSCEPVPPHLYVKLVITNTILTKEGNFAE